MRCASLPLGVDRPPPCRAALLSLLRTAHEALAHAGVQHWLDFGTLLGALREHSIIAHTNDAEIGSLFTSKGDILALSAALLRCGVEMRNMAHSNERNGVGVVDYIELVDLRHISEQGPEVKLDISLRTFLWLDAEEVGAEPGVVRRQRVLADPTDTYANTARTAFSAAQLLPLRRCELGGVGFPCPAEGEALLRRYYGEDWRTVRRDLHVANMAAKERQQGFDAVRSEL